MAYLGETPIEISKTEFKDFTPQDWALYYIQLYGGFDGAHHKDWVLYQVARILHGTPISMVEAKWDDHEPELRFTTVEPPSQAYLDWVISIRGEYDEENDEYEYGYEEGIAP